MMGSRSRSSSRKIFNPRGASIPILADPSVVRRRVILISSPMKIACDGFLLRTNMVQILCLAGPGSRFPGLAFLVVVPEFTVNSENHFGRNISTCVSQRWLLCQKSQEPWADESAVAAETLKPFAETLAPGVIGHIANQLEYFGFRQSVEHWSEGFVQVGRTWSFCFRRNDLKRSLDDVSRRLPASRVTNTIDKNPNFASFTMLDRFPNETGLFQLPPSRPLRISAKSQSLLNFDIRGTVNAPQFDVLEYSPLLSGQGNRARTSVDFVMRCFSLHG